MQVELLTDIVLGAVKALNVSLGWIIDNKELVISAVSGVAAAYTALKVAAGISTVLNLVTTGFQMATAALAWYRSGIISTIIYEGILRGIMAISPFGLIVTGISLAVAAGVALWRNWDTVSAKAIALWGKVKELWGVFINNPLVKLLAQLNPITVVAMAIYKNFDKITSAFNKLRTAISNFKMPQWMKDLGTKYTNTVNKINNAVNSYGKNYDGSHATGLNSVPFDGYIAQLHRGEMVVPAAQAEQLRSSGMDVKNPNAINSSSSVVNAPSTSTTTTTNVTKGGNTFNLHVSGLTVDEVINKLVPQLEKAIANM